MTHSQPVSWFQLDPGGTIFVKPPRLSAEQAEALNAAMRQSAAALAGARASFEAAAPRIVAAMTGIRDAMHEVLKDHPPVRANARPSDEHP